MSDPRPLHREVIERASRWYVFIFLNVYGLAKIFGRQFYRQGRIPADVAQTPLGEASAFDLAWTFMGYSFEYILFLGLAEVIGAWLLLWKRTTLLGVAVLIPIMTNIIVFDIIFLDMFGALASATIYTILLFVIIALNREAVTRAIHALIPDPQPPIPRGRKLRVVLFSLVLMAAIFAFDQILVTLLGHGRG